MTRVAILISGGGSNMVKLIESMTGPGSGDHPGHPCLVLSNDPAAAGLNRAAALAVPVAAVDHRTFGRDRAGFEAALSARLDDAGAEVIALAGFMRVLTPEFVARWAGRVVNIHPSLLPKYPGLNTHQRALDAGDTQAGCTVHEVTADLDAGPILGQARVPVQSDDTAASLAERVLAAEHRLYPMVLQRWLSGGDLPVMLG